MTTPQRPIIRYFGGKWRLAPWIIEHFPQHTVYCEPYGGAASVLLRKAPSKIEVWNDLNGELVNLFRVLQNREQSRKLLRALRFTLWSREEQHTAFVPADCPVESARRFVVRHWMNINNSGSSRSGFRVDITGKVAVPPNASWVGYMKQFSSYIARLSGIVIEHELAINVVKRYDRSETLFYVDPPYVTETRESKNEYHTEMTDQDHCDLATALHGVSGYVVLSGYDCDLYRDLYQDWACVSRQAQINGNRSKTEVLWLNPRAASAQKQMKLF